MDSQLPKYKSLARKSGLATFFLILFAIKEALPVGHHLMIFSLLSPTLRFRAKV